MATEVEQLQSLENQRTALLAKHAGELLELDKKRDAIRQSQIDALKKQASDLGLSVTFKDNQKSKKTSTGRKPLTCSRCGAVGLPGEAHTARTHDKWLADQSDDIQAKFK